MGRFLGNSSKDGAAEGRGDEPVETGGSEFAKKDLYKKGVNQMASEKLQEAIRTFDLSRVAYMSCSATCLIRCMHCHEN